MPPKPSAKTQQKVKQKVAEDKTFGLKNKNKSAKVKYVKLSMKSVIRAYSSSRCGAGYWIVLGKTVTTSRLSRNTGCCIALCSILQPSLLDHHCRQCWNR
jgi:hypothetical protein